MPRTLISGGQTGVDRAALDFAAERGIGRAGWCPAGRWAEDGPIHAAYPLRETPSAEPAQRTAWNVRDSDATLVLHRGNLRGGTARTIAEAERLGRPHMAVDLDAPHAIPSARRWLAAVAPATLNVAGPRESEAPGIHVATLSFLQDLLSTEP